MTNSVSLLSGKEVVYLRSQHLARIATSSPDGIPDVAPAGFDFDGRFVNVSNCFLFVTVAVVVVPVVLLVQPWQTVDTRL